MFSARSSCTHCFCRIPYRGYPDFDCPFRKVIEVWRFAPAAWIPCMHCHAWCSIASLIRV
jgi:hypothetical protein